MAWEQLEQQYVDKINDLGKYSENMQEKIDLLEGTCKKALKEVKRLEDLLADRDQDLEKFQEQLDNLKKVVFLKDLKLLELQMSRGKGYFSLSDENEFFQKQQSKRVILEDKDD